MPETKTKAVQPSEMRTIRTIEIALDEVTYLSAPDGMNVGGPPKRTNLERMYVGSLSNDEATRAYAALTALLQELNRHD